MSDPAGRTAAGRRKLGVSALGRNYGGVFFSECLHPLLHPSSLPSPPRGEGEVGEVEGDEEGSHPVGSKLFRGVKPEEPETEYGWIKVGKVVGCYKGEVIHEVRQFWEKPDRRIAEWLWRRELSGTAWLSW